MSTPLFGIKVVEFANLLPGPLASLMMRQAGAEVVKIERPGTGDEMRRFKPAIEGMSVYFAWANRGKKSVVLDLKTPEGLAVARSLLADADVLIEQFRPGIMDRLGLGYADVARINSRLVYCSITGYGARDPRSSQAAHDLNYQAELGLIDVPARGSDGTPPLPPTLLADIAGGSYAALTNILLALINRDKTGRGAFIDIGMYQGLYPFAWWTLLQGASTGKWPAPGLGRHSGGIPRYNLYPTRDGRCLALAALEDRFWKRFQELAGLDIRPEEEESNPREAIERVAARLKEKTAEEWLRVFNNEDVCCNLVSSVKESYRALDTGGSGIPVIPLPLDPTFLVPDRETEKAPKLGEHTHLFDTGAGR